MVNTLVSIYFGSPRLDMNKHKSRKISDCWSKEWLNFGWMDLGLVSWPQQLYDFLRKIFLMIYSVNWPNFIVLGGDLMIPVGRDEILSRFHGILAILWQFRKTDRFPLI